MLRIGCCWALLLCAIPVHAAVFQEDFATDPSLRGWQSQNLGTAYGWNRAQQNLSAPGDSPTGTGRFGYAQPSQRMALPLPTLQTDQYSFSWQMTTNLQTSSTGDDSVGLYIGLIDPMGTNWTGPCDNAVLQILGQPGATGLRVALRLNVREAGGGQKALYTSTVTRTPQQLQTIGMAYDADTRTFTSSLGLSLTLSDTQSFALGAFSIGTRDDNGWDASKYFTGSLDDLELHYHAAHTPEPATGVMLGLASLAWYRRR